MSSYDWLIHFTDVGFVTEIFLWHFYMGLIPHTSGLWLRTVDHVFKYVKYWHIKKKYNTSGIANILPFL